MIGDGASIHLEAEPAAALPPESCFQSLTEASDFFEGGCVGFSATCDPGRFDGLRLQTKTWNVEPLAVQEVRSSWFSNPAHFPSGSLAFDHALIMRDIPHEWQAVEDYPRKTDG
jgi:hypothetical protein